MKQTSFVLMVFLLLISNYSMAQTTETNQSLFGFINSDVVFFSLIIIGVSAFLRNKNKLFVYQDYTDAVLSTVGVILSISALGSSQANLLSVYATFAIPLIIILASSVALNGLNIYAILSFASKIIMSYILLFIILTVVCLFILKIFSGFFNRNRGRTESEFAYLMNEIKSLFIDTLAILSSFAFFGLVTKFLCKNPQFSNPLEFIKTITPIEIMTKIQGNASASGQ